MKFIGSKASGSAEDLRQQEQELRQNQLQERQFERELEQHRIIKGSSDNLGRPVI